MDELIDKEQTIISLMLGDPISPEAFEQIKGHIPDTNPDTERVTVEVTLRPGFSFEEGTERVERILDLIRQTARNKLKLRDEGIVPTPALIRGILEKISSKITDGEYAAMEAMLSEPSGTRKAGHPVAGSTSETLGRQELVPPPTSVAATASPQPPPVPAAVPSDDEEDDYLDEQARAEFNAASEERMAPPAVPAPPMSAPEPPVEAAPKEPPPVAQAAPVAVTVPPQPVAAIRKKAMTTAVLIPPSGQAAPTPALGVAAPTVAPAPAVPAPSPPPPVAAAPPQVPVPSLVQAAPLPAPAPVVQAAQPAPVAAPPVQVAPALSPLEWDEWQLGLDPGWRRLRTTIRNAFVAALDEDEEPTVRWASRQYVRALADDLDGERAIEDYGRDACDAGIRLVKRFEAEVLSAA